MTGKQRSISSSLVAEYTVICSPLSKKMPLSVGLGGDKKIWIFEIQSRISQVCLRAF
tara:strand:- start:249 stop:419 length:171 start_codon:yes stop_codon:yes gene_type:complete